MKFLSPLLALVLAAASTSVASAQCPPRTVLDPGGLAGDQFGSSVAFDGTTLVAGRRGPIDEGGVVVWRKVGGELVLEAEIDELTGYPPTIFSHLGQHARVEGDTLALYGLDPPVLALFERTVDPVDGSVTWAEDAIFAVPAGATFFGQQLALDGDLVAVGIPNSGGNDQGQVAYSHRVAGTWGPVQTLFSPTPEVGGFFGGAVDLLGNRLAVTASEGSFDRVHVFDFNSTTGEFVPRSILNNNEFGAFGDAIALGGTGVVPKIYVSNWNANVLPNFNVGKVRVYTEQLQPFPNPPIWVLTEDITPSDAVFDGAFGYSLDLHEPFFGTKRLVVGAPLRGESGAVYVFESSGNGFEEVRVLEGLPRGTDATVGPAFGEQVALAGQTLVATHRYLDGPAGEVDQGAAILHELDPSSCPLDCTQPRLATTDPEELARLGEDVALEGDMALVGVPGDDELGQDAGAVRVYRRLGGCWYYDSTLRASDGQAGDFFGNSVAMSSNGTYAVVGARHRDSGGAENAGAAYVFVRTGAVWVETEVLEPPNPTEHGLFGWDVDIETGVLTYAVVGEPRTFFDRGRAHRFELFFLSGTWEHVETHTSPFQFLGQGDEYGRSVSTSSSFYVVGDPRADAGVGFSGAVSGFKREPFFGAWQSTGTVLGSSSNERFGESVATNGVSLVVGAPTATVSGVMRAGRVDLFQVSPSGAMTPNGSGLAPSPMENAYLGESVALEGSRVLAGSMELGVDTGSAHLFDPGPGGLTHVGAIVPPGGVVTGRFGTSVAFDGDDLLVGAPYDEDQGVLGGSAWIFDATEVRTLEVDRPFVSQEDGGKQSLAVHMGPALGGHIYWIVGSATGTSPGVPFPPFVLPLNFDLYYKITLKHFNGQIFQKTLGFLDAQGRAQAAFNMPPGAPVLAGAYHHAALILDPVTLLPTGATNATLVTFAP